MSTPFRPHDLLWLTPGADLQTDLPLPSWAADRIAQGLPVVVRRGPWTGGQVPVGVRGATRSQRLAMRVEPRWVTRALAPEELRDVAPRDPERGDLPAFRTLALLGERLPSGTRWGPTGSAGFELATGWPTVTAASDLDLLVRCPEPLSRVDARAWVAACSGLPVRCDLQLDTGRGGVALAEWAAGRAEVLVKTDGGPQLVGDPWADAP